MTNVDDTLLKEIAKELDRGGMAAFPTETVYGLGADAANPEAIRRVYALKGRPADHPSIVHLAKAEDITLWAEYIPEAAWKLARHFWPGPMTLILPKKQCVLSQVTGGQDSVGLRVPAHPLTRRLIEIFGRGLIGPSANRFGHISPTCAEHVRTEFGNELRYIIDGGPCKVGIESAIIDFSKEKPVIVRPGMLNADIISDFLGERIDLGEGSRAPGTLKKHYAPTSSASIVSSSEIDKVISSGADDIAVLKFGTSTLNTGSGVTVTAMPSSPEAYARDFYAYLRYADSTSPKQILIEAPPRTPEWTAVWDRMTRACAK